MRMKKFISPILVYALLLVACGNDGTSTDQAQLENELENIKELEPNLSDDKITSILSSIPSPLELSVQIQEMGIEYNRDMLNNADNINKYNSRYRKALNLGIYGTDLGYTNIYQHTQDGLNYLNAIRQLASDLNISQFLNFESIKELTSAKSNLDSLLMITNQNFDQINSHFRETNQSSLSTLLLTGGWLEALYITTQVALKHPDSKELMERIGEQKIVLGNIMVLLDSYSRNDAEIKELMLEMQDLEELFKKIEITYTYGEATSKIVDGVIEIQNTSTSNVVITKEDIENITKTTEIIRNSIIG